MDNSIKKKSPGRPKGSQNKSTMEVKQTLNNLWNDNVEYIQQELDKMRKRNEGEKFLHFFLALTKFVVPTLNYNQIEAETDNRIEVTIHYDEPLFIENKN